MIVVVATCIGTFSSTLFLLQITFQVKFYGFRNWWSTGLGTGLSREEAAMRESDKLSAEAKMLVHELVKEGDEIKHDADDMK